MKYKTQRNQLLFFFFLICFQILQARNLNNKETHSVALELKSSPSTQQSLTADKINKPNQSNSIISNQKPITQVNNIF